MVLHPRRHARLLYKQADRDGLLHRGVGELLLMRERERLRQAECRRDRKRVPPRRHREAAGLPAERGLTIHELNERTAADPIDTSTDEVGIASWTAALLLIRWTSADWQPGRFVLSDAGVRKLVETRLLALRSAIAVLAGYGRLPVGDINGWWLITARSWLSDHEIGRVFAAADWLGVGTHDGSLIAKALAAVTCTDDELARQAIKRWQRLRALGWGDTRRLSPRTG